MLSSLPWNLTSALEKQNQNRLFMLNKCARSNLNNHAGKQPLLAAM